MCSLQPYVKCKIPFWIANASNSFLTKTLFFKKSKQCTTLHKNDYLQYRSNQEYEAEGGEDESFIERLKSDKGDQDNFFDEDFDPVLRDIQERNPNSDRSDDDHRYPHLLIFFSYHIFYKEVHKDLLFGAN